MFLIIFQFFHLDKIFKFIFLNDVADNILTNSRKNINFTGILAFKSLHLHLFLIENKEFFKI